MVESSHEPSTPDGGVTNTRVELHLSIGFPPDLDELGLSDADRTLYLTGYVRGQVECL